MPFEAGARLGPYEIRAPLGAGGMGEVYRARDPRLNRTVAIKVLPGHFAASAELRERFEREARTIASLNHPHICTLHDVGHHEGVDFLVLEFLQGHTLEERLKKGPLPLTMSLQIGVEIADALAVAHRAGIVHRDLKPGNIMLTAGGAKLLDFGLAREEGPVVASGLSMLPTTPPNLTARGSILGTLQYMAPEQLEGQDADARTDIFAFGAVLYEMVAGKRAFEGKSQAGLIAAILDREPPPLTQIQPATPPLLEHLIAQCLAKNPNERWQSASDLLRELKWVANHGAAAAPVATQPPRRRGAWLAAGAAILFFAMSLVTLPLAVQRLREKPPVIEPVRFQIPMPEKVTLGTGAFALSPDGRQLAFAPVDANGRTRLWVRSLDSLEARPLAGTEDAGNFPPFWSPDSRFIAFATAGKYIKVPAAGGPAQTLAELPGTLGASAWSRNGVVLLTANPGGLWRVPDTGGVPSPVTIVDSARGETYHAKPSFLPDGRHFLYLRVSGNANVAGTYLGSLDVKPEQQPRERLLPGPLGAQYLASSDPATGYVLFLRDTTLMVQPFDNRSLELTGQATPIAEQVGNNGIISGFFSASENGVLAYRVGSGAGRHFAWVDREGKVLSSTGDPLPYNEIALSPDATRVASSRIDGQRDIWLVEFARSIGTRFTFNPSADTSPLWSPDGNRLVFASNRDGRFDLFQKTSNGAGEDELLLKSDENKAATSWSRDGRFIIYQSLSPKTKGDLWALSLERDRKPIPLLQTSFNDIFGVLSPDSRWIAYDSDESGRFELYVRPFAPAAVAGPSSPAGKWQVSKAGAVAAKAAWRRDGKELFYMSPDRRLMSVEVAASSIFSSGVPQPMFFAPNVNWDVAADGKRFLFVTPLAENEQTSITLVLNWTTLLKN
jgi:Tol biopolymer transport system component